MAQNPPLGRSYTYSLSSGSTFSTPVRPMPGIVTPEVEGSLLQDPDLPAGVLHETSDAPGAPARVDFHTFTVACP